MTLEEQINTPDLPFYIEDELTAASEKNPSKAAAIFTLLFEQHKGSIKAAAEIRQNIGVMWCSTNTNEAIAAYKRACQLDPHNA